MRASLSRLVIAASLVAGCSSAGPAVTSPPAATAAPPRTPAATEIRPTDAPAGSPSPAATPTAAPTATPTAAPILKTIQDLIAEKHPAVKAKAAIAAIKAAYAADPTATSAYPYGLSNLECFNPPADPNPKFVWSGIQDECAAKVGNLFNVYTHNGMHEFYDAALLSYNFFVNLPSPPRLGTKSAAVDSINKWLLAFRP